MFKYDKEEEEDKATYYPNINDILGLFSSSSSTPSTQQGKDYTTGSCSPKVVYDVKSISYLPGINPADFIRKDSIPCYGCTVP